MHLTIPTPGLDLARSLLATLLEDYSTANADVLTASEALLTLDDVYPPHPPASAGPGAAVSLSQVADQLRRASEASGDAAELARITAALDVLARRGSPS